MKISENYSLLKHNTFGLDIKTRWFVEYENEEDLQKLLYDEYFFSQPFIHIGQGSNLLFLGDYSGIVVHSLIQGIEVVKEEENHVWIKAGAGVEWDSFVAYCAEKGWGGIENLSGIPGEVGASAVQNIGAYGVEVCDTITEVHTYNIVTGEKQIFKNEDCKFTYRHSIFKEETHRGKHFVTHVIYKLSKQPVYNLDYGYLKTVLDGKDVNLKTIREAVISIRDAKLPDPKKLGNAGSFFMNPYICMAHYEGLKEKYPDIPSYPVDGKVVKIPAAWLIEQCGLKGKTIGHAAIHEKQPLVIINKGEATADDIASLASLVCDEVKKKFSIELQKEVLFI
ncbi:MAG: UDP-N-acetylmuramate dehydrogenase [Dysgonamonadaceae bacterium]|jgi:UDP-N-acetylmuramate dehydrogenase|nr:UDP-N-acetylmuramate dehydrogenase [Dysgonamonadaceae bacterium]